MCNASHHEVPLGPGLGPRSIGADGEVAIQADTHRLGCAGCRRELPVGEPLLPRNPRHLVRVRAREARHDGRARVLKGLRPAVPIACAQAFGEHVRAQREVQAVALERRALQRAERCKLVHRGFAIRRTPIGKHELAECAP